MFFVTGFNLMQSWGQVKWFLKGYFFSDAAARSPQFRGSGREDRGKVEKNENKMKPTSMN